MSPRREIRPKTPGKAPERGPPPFGRPLCWVHTRGRRAVSVRRPRTHPPVHGPWPVDLFLGNLCSAAQTEITPPVTAPDLQAAKRGASYMATLKLKPID